MKIRLPKSQMALLRQLRLNLRNTNAQLLFSGQPFETILTLLNVRRELSWAIKGLEFEGERRIYGK